MSLVKFKLNSQKLRNINIYIQRKHICWLQLIIKLAAEIQLSGLREIGLELVHLNACQTGRIHYIYVVQPIPKLKQFHFGSLLIIKKKTHVCVFMLTPLTASLKKTISRDYSIRWLCFLLPIEIIFEDHHIYCFESRKNQDKPTLKISGYSPFQARCDVWEPQRIFFLKNTTQPHPLPLSNKPMKLIGAVARACAGRKLYHILYIPVRGPIHH